MDKKKRFQSPPPADPITAVRESSLAFRLNTGFFLRQVGIFLVMDLLLVALAFVGLVAYAENRCADVAVLVEERGVPSEETLAWMEASDYTIAPLDRAPQGLELPAISWVPVREELSGALRSWDLAHYYRVELYSGSSAYAIQVDLSGIFRTLYWAGIVLLICQGLSLLTNLFRNNRSIRKVLRPIQELASAAARLNSMTHMSRRELENLAGELDKINAKHLDSRIDLPATQKELRALAQAINDMLDRVNRAYSAQMRFVSDASHELRTPIAVIQGYANLLNRWGKDDPATRQEAIDAIRQEADSMKELVEQLLFLARGDNDSMHIEMETFDLTEVAAEVLKETGMIDQTHTFSARWEGAVPVCADVGLTKQALRILVDNSIKYTPAGGHITLSAALRDGMARLSVQDEGQGIDAGSLPHVFDRFYRTDQSRARQTGGTGLGLAIAKWIVDRHGGWFEVRSWPGVGTRMTIVLPVAELDAGGADEDAEQTRPA